MRILVLDKEDVASEAARMVAETVRAAVAARGRACLAFSGGRTPWPMFRALAVEDLPWRDIHIFQTDERAVPQDDPARTLPLLSDALLSHVPLEPQHVHPMPVEGSDLAEGARRYAAVLREIAGTQLDLVHLGLGDDGHTASLVPGDPVLDIDNKDVAVSGPYQGHRRMTLTYPTLDRARTLLWLVTGTDKAEVLRRLCGGDRAIPAGRVAPEYATVIADRDAARLLPDAVTGRS